MAEEKSSMWLRITEIIIGLIGTCAGWLRSCVSRNSGSDSHRIPCSRAPYSKLCRIRPDFFRRHLRMAATSTVDSISDRISTRNSNTHRPGLLWRINPRVAGGTGVDLYGIRGDRTRHSGDDNSRHHRSYSRLCRVSISSARRSHCSTFAGDSSDHIRVGVDSIRPLGKMGVTHPLSLFFVHPRKKTFRRTSLLRTQQETDRLNEIGVWHLAGHRSSSL